MDRRNFLTTLAGATAIAGSSAACEIKGSTLKGKVALLTGGARGIGKEIALGLARAGCSVVIVDIGDSKAISSLKHYETSATDLLKETEKDVSALGVRCSALVGDVRNFDRMVEICNETVKKFEKIDFVIANAGIADFSYLESQSLTSVRDIIDVNLLGAIHTFKAAIPHVKKSPKGRLIAISSILSRQGAEGLSAYCASKWAVNGLVKSLALELGPYNISVNAVAPAAVDTLLYKKNAPSLRSSGKRSVSRSRLPLGGEYIDPKSISSLVNYLCSEEGAPISGSILDVSGGLSATHGG